MNILSCVGSHSVLTTVALAMSNVTAAIDSLEGGARVPPHTPIDKSREYSLGEWKESIDSSPILCIGDYTASA